MSENIENKSEKKENFANAYQRLTEIIAWFRDDKKFNLDEGLKKSKEGVELLRLLKGRLQEVEKEYIDIKREYEKDFGLDKNEKPK